MERKYRDYLMEQLQNLLAIDSTTGFCYAIEDYLAEQYEQMGYSVHRFNRGGLMVDLGGTGDTIVVTAHADTIGLMVRAIKPSGHLSVIAVGGLFPAYADRENVRLYTRSGKVYTGFIQRENPSVHMADLSVREGVGPMSFSEDFEVVLDNPVNCREDAAPLGIECGDILALEPRFVLTESGYIKSRYLDDKTGIAIQLAYARMLVDMHIVPKRHVYLHVSVTEEVGWGACYGLPGDAKEMLALDIACVGPDNYSTEEKVSICAHDGKWQYDYRMVSALKDAAEHAGVDYAIDLFYPYYSSDIEDMLSAGYDVRAVVVGPGVLATHGYERTTMCALEQTFGLLDEYLGRGN